jgi:hypothetical protein
MPGGHLVALSQPVELAGRLISYAETSAPADNGVPRTPRRR